MIKRLTVFSIASLFIALAFSQHGPTADHLSYEIESFAPGESPYYLTVFVIPSRVSYDWDSPHGLYRSFVKNYKRSLFHKVNYLLGHAFIELKAPGVEEEVFTGMRAVTRKEQQEKVLKQKYGLSILGTDLKGRLEIPGRLREKMEHFSEKGEMAFMTFLVNQEAAGRMHEFFRVFSSGDDTLTSPRFHYGGAYWPRYHGEGAGCSAFAVAFLDLGGIFREDYEEWKVRINIPTDLMGGPYNPGNEVKLKDIRRRQHWAGSGEAHEPFWIYDPTYMFFWIQEHWMDNEINGLPSKPVVINDAHGILIDARQVPAPTDEPIFMERQEPSVFVK